MREKYGAGAVAAAMLLSLAAPARGQEARPLKVSAGAAFKHRHSRLQLPPTLAGLPRGEVQDLDTDELDVGTSYGSADNGEVYTVYVTRHVAGSLAVWFDRSRWMIEHAGAAGTPAGEVIAGPFVPPGRSSAAGLAAAYAVTGKSYRSTAVAIVPAGEWLVKVRATSSTLSPAELDARVKAALAELGWPKKMPPAPTAAPVQACDSALAFTGEAKRLEGEDAGMGALLGAMIGQIAAKQPQEKEADVAEPLWCRDPAAPDVYRPDGSRDRYLIALADSGRAVSVGQSPGLQLLAQVDDSKKVAPGYSVALVLLGATAQSSDLDRLPSPAQAMKIVEARQWASSFPTWGKDKGKVNVSLDAVK